MMTLIGASLAALTAATALLMAQPCLHIYKVNTPHQKGIVIGIATGFCGRLRAFDSPQNDAGIGLPLPNDYRPLETKYTPLEGILNATRNGIDSRRWG